jgi:hypothetical protein
MQHGSGMYVRESMLLRCRAVCAPRSHAKRNETGGDAMQRRRRRFLRLPSCNAAVSLTQRGVTSSADTEQQLQARDEKPLPVTRRRGDRDGMRGGCAAAHASVAHACRRAGRAPRTRRRRQVRQWRDARTTRRGGARAFHASVAPRAGERKLTRPLCTTETRSCWELRTSTSCGTAAGAASSE